METTNELYRDNTRDSHWLGEVVNNEDPLYSGRCRIKVFGKFDLLPEEAIPWASPMNRNLPGAHAVPRVGDIVSVRFDNGNIYHPEYWFQVNQNDTLKSEVLENSEEPQNVISLVYDEQRNLRVYYSVEDGLVITTGESNTEAPMIRFSPEGQIFINSGDIFIATNDGTDESEPAVRGKSLEEWLNKLLDDYLAHTHPTGVGPSGPPLPPTASLVPQLKGEHVNYQQTGK
jgi:hypothetical protein